MAIRRSPTCRETQRPCIRGSTRRARRHRKKTVSATAQSNIAVSDEQRRAMISKAAYLRAESAAWLRRSGCELEDWLIAETRGGCAPVRASRRAPQ